MKKILIALMAMFAMTANTYAEDKIVISDVAIPEKGTANLEVIIINQERQCLGFQFDIKLPEGITAKTNASNLTDRAKKVSENWSVAFKQTDVENNIWNCIAFNMENAPIDGTDGAVLNIALTADETLTNGMEFEGTLMNVVMASRPDKYEPEGCTFKVTIVENRITFDETATELPDVYGNQNVLVKRTIKADQWNTICLPFAISAEQLAQVFGEDVKLAELTGSDATYASDDDKYASAIDVQFKTTTTFKANTPYIIKVAENVTEFKLDNVEVDIDEENAYVEIDNGKRGRNRQVLAAFIGNYKAETPVPEGDLYISSNKFYYSAGSTKIKGFRGYFELADQVDTSLLAKISFSVDDEATSIEGIGVQRNVEGVYDLSGRKIKVQNNDLNTLQKGVYIIDGKKVTIK